MSSSMDDAFDGEGSGSSSSGSHCESGRELEYFGWVYHLGVNSIGHGYCHLRFLFLRGDSVAMYKRDPHQHPGIIPIRKGAISHTLMVEDLGRREVNSMELSVLRFYNRLDETKKGEIACASAREAKKWMEAFEQVKQQALHDLSMETARRKLNADGELNLEGHRRRVRHYAHGLKRLIRIGKGPEPLIRKTSVVKFTNRINPHSGVDLDDAIEAHDWKCARTVNGVRIFEDVANSKGSGTFLLKAVGIVDASVETVLEAILSLDTRKRHEWDVLTGELELLQLVDGQSDVVYGTYEPKNLNWWHSKKDFVFSRQWFRLQDGSCIILQIPAAHKKRPPRPGYQRIKISPSTWEIRKLSTSESSSKCLVTLMLEVHSSVWNRFKPDICSNFEKSISYGLLSQVEGLKQYFGANPSLSFDSLSIREYSDSSDSFISDDDDDSNLEDEFYDALAKVDSVEDEDSDDDNDLPKAGKMTLTDLSSVTASLDLKNTADMPKRSEMDIKISPTAINPDKFQGSLHQGKGESDTNCWTTPNGQGFMIRGKNYLTDNSKIVGGDPLLKLFAVDFLKAEKSIDNIALHPNCLVQSEAGKALPFILIINLQIPSKPYYSMVLYFGSERPISKESLLGRFVDGSDTFRDSRFKLIPSIVEGYWMVKRAVGTKACLLAKAVTCRYLRQDNFLEIDVDVGSSSVARTVIGLVLGYVTGLVVDLAILIEATEAGELPEYILGSVRLNRVSLDSVPSF